MYHRGFIYRYWGSLLNGVIVTTRAFHPVAAVVPVQVAVEALVPNESPCPSVGHGGADVGDTGCVVPRVLIVRRIDD